MTSLPRLRHNIAALGSIQIAGYLLPLITLPYLTRVLGVEAWGTVALVQIVIGYFTLITNWGFGISGTRKIAADRNNLKKVTDIFLAIWTAQWLLSAAAIILLAFLILFSPFFKQNEMYYLWGIGGIIGNVLFPVWLLNGLERMKQVAIIQIGTRAAAIPLIFIFIKSPEDAPLMLGIGAATGILSGALTLAWIHKYIGVEWRWPSKARIIDELQEGMAIFTSTVWIGLYTTLTPMILSLFAGNAAVGYYALADRTRQLAQSALTPISQALFPRMSHLFQTDSEQARVILLRTSKLILLVSASASLVLWAFGEHIIIVLAGEQFRPAIDVLQWLAPLPFVISLSNILGIQILLPNRKTKAFNRILGVAGALSLTMIFLLIQWKGAEGASINTLITECFVTLAMALYIWKTGFFNNSKSWNNT